MLRIKLFAPNANVAGGRVAPVWLLVHGLPGYTAWCGKSRMRLGCPLWQLLLEYVINLSINQSKHMIMAPGWP
eukprot:jgi/Chrzof1/10604/Cz05g04310.t1